jgi:hypothetical protein
VNRAGTTRAPGWCCVCGAGAASNNSFSDGSRNDGTPAPHVAPKSSTVTQARSSLPRSVLQIDRSDSHVQSAQVAYLSSVFKYECELKLFFLYELSVRDLPVWTVCLVSTKSRENLEYDKVRGW